MQTPSAPSSIAQLADCDFGSYEEAMAAVVSVSEANGFAASIKRSFKEDELGFPQRHDLECVHCWQKPTEKMGKRESVSALRKLPLVCVFEVLQKPRQLALCYEDRPALARGGL